MSSRRFRKGEVFFGLVLLDCLTNEGLCTLWADMLMTSVRLYQSFPERFLGQRLGFGLAVYGKPYYLLPASLQAIRCLS
jgi:hypothetical protein